MGLPSRRCRALAHGSGINRTPELLKNSVYANFAESPKGEVRRIPIRRTPVNKGKKWKGRSCYAPASMLERTVGIEPTPPYRKYGALQSCVRKNRAIPY